MENMIYETEKYRADDIVTEEAEEELDVVEGDEEPTPKKKPAEGEVIDDPATDKVDGEGEEDEDDDDDDDAPAEELLDEENF